ncbi:SWIRM domain-containing protein [Cercospora beticola]|uniref:SWIRM domain-containing protein n=1 Tax=Cercospora beticola TaxID=122368 RepID=A0A2G5I3H6_CERBT|nr:SWIRM domain-containing protein [Cercospora beticola]PIA99365.1 SWIRM domain-containing protein [Cercospora beticola]WPA99729.1 hypothetical protein RHO25_004348 [Cercospora beticola]CAK1362122.1 unnamed protein product [Cercospora beticola]
MALSQPQQEKKRMGTGSHLLTPEEPTIDSFDEPQPVRVVEPRSPPESPAFRPLSALDAASQEDQQLYPVSDSTHAQPLFHSNTTPRTTPDRDSSASVASEPATSPKTPISGKDQHWSRKNSSGVIGIVQRYNADPHAWRQKCLDELMEMKRLKLEARQLPPPTSRPVNRDSHTQRLLESLGKSRVAKSTPAAVETIERRSEKVASPIRPTRANASDESRRQPPTKRHIRQTSTPTNTLAALSQASAAPKPRTRQPPSKVVERKDQSWTEVVDYCPPKESLDSMSRKLSVEWTNKNHQDLSQDPDRVHLHPQELAVASTLRLKCDRYLLIKRLIFQEKVKFLKENKEFNKTSAQNCCNVDVNKISKLWQSFNDVGWFDRHWFEQYLN